MTLRRVGLMPAVAVAIFLWQRDGAAVLALALVACVDWFFCWGWGVKGFSEDERRIVDRYRDWLTQQLVEADAENEAPAGGEGLQ